MNISNMNWVSSIPAISRHTGVQQQNDKLAVRPYTYGKSTNSAKYTSMGSGFSFITNSEENLPVQTLQTLVSSDNAYTKQDAIMAQWNKQGSFNIYDVMEGKAQVPLQNPNPSAEELKEFEKALQQNGISKEIDWSNLSFDFKGLTFQKSAFGKEYDFNSVRGEEFQKKTEYIVSRYAAVSHKINQNYTGEQRQEQIEKLNSIYQSTIKEMAQSYTDIVGGFLEENGMAQEKEKIYQSMIAAANEKAATYEKYLSENDDFLGIAGTEDAWLLDDEEYIAARLREQNISETEEQSSEHYNLKDLEILGEYSYTASAMEKGMIYKRDEERLGIDFAVMAMKADTVQKSGKTSSQFNEMFAKLTDNFVNQFLDKMDKALEKERKAGNVYDAEQGFAKLDRNAVWNVYNKTMQEYQQNGDAMKALLEGAKFGAEQHSKGISSSYRDRNSDAYWNHFFDKGSSVGKYQDSDTDYQTYLNDWANFEKSLKYGKDNIDKRA